MMKPQSHLHCCTRGRWRDPWSADSRCSPGISEGFPINAMMISMTPMMAMIVIMMVKRMNPTSKVSMFLIRALAFSSKSRPGPIALLKYLICDNQPFHFNHIKIQIKNLKQHGKVKHDKDFLGFRVWVAFLILLILIDPVHSCLNITVGGFLNSYIYKGKVHRKKKKRKTDKCLF